MVSWFDIIMLARLEGAKTVKGSLETGCEGNRDGGHSQQSPRNLTSRYFLIVANAYLTDW